MSHTRTLAAFLARLSYVDLPEAVLARTEDLFLDWLGSALASQGAHPIPLFERYAATMGPAHGPATLLVNGQGTSAYFAALVNGASSHLVEQDDLHNSSVLHPATVVFPAVLAAAQDLGKSGAELLLAVGGRLRSRHPHRRIPRPLALPDFPYHGDRRHPGRRGGGRQTDGL